MDDRVLESLVPVVLADETLTLRSRFEFDAAYVRMIGPHEIAGLDRLIQVVVAHGAVRERAAEGAPPGGVGVIRVRSRIDEDFAIPDIEHERQCIRMAMRGDAEITQGTG